VEKSQEMKKGCVGLHDNSIGSMSDGANERIFGFQLILTMKKEG
jgi:hypothetical protein